MRKPTTKEIILRWLSVALALAAFLFGANWGNGDPCLGDSVFAALGLPSWTGGAGIGLHLPVLLAILVILGAGLLFASTTLRKKRTFLLLVLGFAVFYFLSFLVVTL